MGELAKLRPHTQADEDMHDFWVSTGRKCLPRAGGFLDQPASIMATLRLLDLKHRIWDHIAAIEAKADEEIKKLDKDQAQKLEEELGLQ